MEQTVFNIRIEKLTKRILDRDAKRHGMSLSDLFRVGARFYGSLPEDFLAWLQWYSDEIEIPLSTVLIHGMQKMIAQYKAWINVFGSTPPGWMREFKWQDGKMIKGDELSETMEAEYTELFQQMKDNLMQSKEKGEPCFLSDEQAFQIIAQR